MGTTTMAEFLIAGVLGYLLGAVPTGVLLCRITRASDVRWSGSGHTGGLNVSRSAGIWVGVLTGVVDALLGVGAVTAGLLLADNPWAAVIAGVMAVVGHNWSVFIRFAGGIGLSTLFGAVLRFTPLPAFGALIILLPVWLILIKLLRVHRARATVLTMIAVGPLLWVLGVSRPGILLGAVGGGIVILKTLPDWNRQYD
jgi:glycerol-3-phosphate acyltransferase PlsY